MIIWDPDPDIVRLGALAVSWYGLLFVLGFIAGRQIIIAIYRRDGKAGADFDGLLIAVVVGTIVGARLGHCLFYEPGFYFSHPLEVLKIWKGGLASHGAAIGILIALAIVARKSGDRYLWIVDRIAIVAALTGSLVRIGNFINSEMIGVPTNGSYGVVFARAVEESLRHLEVVGQADIRKDAGARPGAEAPVTIDIRFKPDRGKEADLQGIVEGEIQFLLRHDPRIERHVAVAVNGALDYELTKDDGTLRALIHARGIPRHPSQLYEAFCCMLVSGVLFRMWWRRKGKLEEGVLTGWFFVVLFSCRLPIEFSKVDQVPAESGLPLNFGQLLSIPFILAGAAVLFWARRRREKTNSGY